MNLMDQGEQGRAEARQIIARWLAERDGYFNITQSTVDWRVPEADDLMERLGWPRGPIP